MPEWELRVVGAALFSGEPGIDQGHGDDVYMLKDAVIDIYLCCLRRNGHSHDI